MANTKLDEVLAVVRDYDHYKDYYRTSVIESKALGRKGFEDTSWMLFLNKSFFMRTALDIDYHITNVRVDENRCYRVSTTTRIQEVERYGESGKRLLPEGEGDGFAWKLYTITRLEQRDEGVYLELEAIELSRRIPVLLRFIVDPIVRNVSRKLLFLTIQQTRDAVASSRQINRLCCAAAKCGKESRAGDASVGLRPSHYRSVCFGAGSWLPCFSLVQRYSRARQPLQQVSHF